MGNSITVRAVIDPPWGGGTKEIISLEGVHPSTHPAPTLYVQPKRQSSPRIFTVHGDHLAKKTPYYSQPKIEVTIC